MTISAILSKVHGPEALLDEIFRGNFRRDGLRCLRVLRLDAGFFGALRDEVGHLVAAHQPSSLTTPSHPAHVTGPEGVVVQYSLLNRSGRFDDSSTDLDASRQGKRFHHAEVYPTLATLIQTFPEATNMRLNGLGPASGIRPHEQNIVFRSGGRLALRVRFHLPVVTNTEATVDVDGHRLHLGAGDIYYVNNGCVHAARNAGEQFRYHLVWDMPLTRSGFARMFAESSDGTPDVASPYLGAERVVPARGVRPVGQYTVGSACFHAYKRSQLQHLGVSPHRFGDVYSRIGYAWCRLRGGLGFAVETIPR